MKKMAAIALLIVVALFVVVYAGDYGILRIRIARNSGYDAVEVRQYYAITEKNNRTEYVFGSTVNQPCVDSLFSHQGLRPCWYLRRHPEQQIKI